MKELDFEEEFHKKNRREDRKERKIASSADRSKYKKSDLSKKKPLIPPSQENTERGRVLSILPEEILIESNGTELLCTLKGAFKKERGKIKNLIAVGDFVHFIPETKQIVYIEERFSVLSRAEHLHRHKEQLLAVNIDQVIITASLLLPPLKPHLIDRYIIAARKGNMTPIIAINKIDFLTSPPAETSADTRLHEKELYEKVLEGYRHLGFLVFPVSAHTGEGLIPLKNAMHGKASCISGQSGVGKSSLLNALIGSQQKVGGLTKATRKGVHTTTAATLIPVEGDGFCIDTPGIRSFGLWQLTREDILSYFSEIAQIGNTCKYPDCNHMGEPSCAVTAAIEEGFIPLLRFESYCALMTTLYRK